MEGPDPIAVSRMFAGVAPRYDLLNRTLSLRTDVRWRKDAVAEVLAVPGVERVADVCTGTADLALLLAARGVEAVGVDFCREMLEVGETKRRRSTRGDRVRLVAGDALALPLRDGACDAAVVAFGIRNVGDPLAALREMARVVRPGGRVVVLEFARPRGRVFAGLYLWYFRSLLPRIGALLSPGSRTSNAYAYLPESVMRFPDRDDFARLMRDAGLVDVGYRMLRFGVCALYRGTVCDGR